MSRAPRHGRGGSRDLDEVVARAQRERLERERGYRDRALALFPWVCGRCGREFDRSNVRELTVHHRDHDHDHNPPDGSNWELLCLYCHDNEHARHVDAQRTGGAPQEANAPSGSHQPFTALRDLLRDRDPDD